ncbi:MAG: nucleotidyltransferase domain-containing protein [Prevotella sp.]|jgi:predicted nucleotidyltransferase|nr:nucleotidyltransferase domain-containing protein [Prevotella sp.]
MYGLTDRSYNELVQILASVPEIDEAVIYGSRARGDYWHASDIDISLKGKGCNRHTLRTLNDMLYESHIPYFFDTNIYADIHNPELKANIDRDGRTIFSRQTVDSRTPRSNVT